jgi:hypothetical protein
VENNKNRKAGIGFGKKTDLDVGKDPHNVAPSPDTYNLPTFVETNKLHEKGFSPLYSREVVGLLKIGNRAYELHRTGAKESTRPWLL